MLAYSTYTVYGLQSGQHKQGEGMLTHPLQQISLMFVLLCSHIQRTSDAKNFQELPLYPPAPFHQLHWIPLMCCIMKCSNQHATALILNKYKIHSHAHCITVKQTVLDWASHMSVILSHDDIHLSSPAQLATLSFAFSPSTQIPSLAVQESWRSQELRAMICN